MFCVLCFVFCFVVFRLLWARISLYDGGGCLFIIRVGKRSKKCCLQLKNGEMGGGNELPCVGAVGQAVRYLVLCGAFPFSSFLSRLWMTAAAAAAAAATAVRLYRIRFVIISLNRAAKQKSNKEGISM